MMIMGSRTLIISSNQARLRPVKDGIPHRRETI